MEARVVIWAQDEGDLVPSGWKDDRIWWQGDEGQGDVKIAPGDLA